MRPKCGLPPGGSLCGLRADPRRAGAHPARGHNAHGITGRARWAQDAQKRVYPVGCMRNIKAAHSADYGHCERCGIFCWHSRSGTGIPTARENGRGRGERVPGVHPDGREALRGVGRLLGRSGTAPAIRHRKKPRTDPGRCAGRGLFEAACCTEKHHQRQQQDEKQMHGDHLQCYCIAFGRGCQEKVGLCSRCMAEICASISGAW